MIYFDDQLEFSVGILEENVANERFAEHKSSSPNVVNDYCPLLSVTFLDKEVLGLVVEHSTYPTDIIGIKECNSEYIIGFRQLLHELDPI